MAKRDRALSSAEQTHAGSFSEPGDGERLAATPAALAVPAVSADEARQRARVLAAGQLTWVATDDGALLDARDWCLFTGQRHDQAAPHGWLDALHPDDRSRASSAWNAALASGEQYTIDIRVRRYDGEYRWLLARVAPVAMEGSPREWIGTALDVAERTEALRAPGRHASEFEVTFDAIADAAFVYDRNGNITRMNPAARELFGLDKFSGYDQREPDERSSLISARDEHDRPLEPEDTGLSRLLRGESLRGTSALDVRVRLFDGRQLDLNIAGAPLRDESGAITGAVAISRDVTARRRMEREVAERERLFRAVFDLAAVGITRVAMNGSFLDVNRRFCDIVGYPREELLARTFQDVTHPDDLDIDLANVERTLRGEIDGYAMEKRYIRKDGSPIWINLTVTLVRDGAGEPQYFISIVEDIDARKHMEEALRASEEKFHTLADNISQLAWMAHADGYIFWYNRRWYDYTGASPESQEGWGWQSAHDPEALPEVMERWQRSLATGEAFDMVFPLRGADGAYRSFLTRIVPVKDEQGRVTAWFGSNTDVTDQMQLQQELRAANAAKDEFLSIAAHELRTPLTSVKANSQLLARQFKRIATSPPDDVAGMLALLLPLQPLLDRTESSLGRLTRLVDDLLDVSRVHAGKLEMRPERVELTALVRDAVEEEAQGWPNRALRLERVLAHEGDATADGPLWVDVDPDRIRQVVSNYLSNAFKYASVGRPIHVRLERIASVARFSVRDEGPGLPVEQQHHLFERFYRVEGINHVQGSGVGLGLGLYICREIVERHGGEVGVESAVGSGSSFWFTLPLAPSPAS